MAFGGNAGWTSRLFAGALALALLLPSGAFAFCQSEQDRQAIQTRLMQTELMVAALACGQRAQYNGFATRYNKALVAQGRDLKATFRSAYGGGSERELNAFVTRVANQASALHQADPRQFCSVAQGVFDRLSKNTPDARYIPSAIDRAPAYGLKACGLVQEAALTDSAKAATR
ncbi:MAG: hypothetical protein ACPGNT_08480 [Rhodospirillales bacterium]